MVKLLVPALKVVTLKGLRRSGKKSYWRQLFHQNSSLVFSETGSVTVKQQKQSVVEVQECSRVSCVTFDRLVRQ